MFDNARTALAFAAVIVVGAGFVAANFEGVRDRSQEARDYETDVYLPLPEPTSAPAHESGQTDYSEVPDGWYDSPYDSFGEYGPATGSEPIDDAQGFDPAPDRSTDPVGEEYVIVESDSSDFAEYETD